MSNGTKLAGAVLGAAVDVIGRIIDLESQGKSAEAKEVADHFVATTKTQLDNDKAEAVGELERRFPESSR